MSRVQRLTAILFGEGGVGKSFIASEIAFAIQNGTDFGGRKTAQGDAVYFAVEDGDGLLRRTLESLDRDCIRANEWGMWSV